MLIFGEKLYLENHIILTDISVNTGSAYFQQT